VYVSDDDCTTWRVLKTLVPDDWSTGYSSLLILPTPQSPPSTSATNTSAVGCLFESRRCQNQVFCSMGISFAVFDA
jgi:hypothetical protein